MSSALFPCPLYISIIRFFINSREINVLIADSLASPCFGEIGVPSVPGRSAKHRRPLDRLYAVPLITALRMQWLPNTSLWHHPDSSCLQLMYNPATCHDTTYTGNAEMWNISFRHDNEIIWTYPFYTNLKYCPSPCCRGNTLVSVVSNGMLLFIHCLLTTSV